MNLEVRPTESPPVHPDYRQVRWGDPRSGDSDIASSVDSRVSQLGEVSDRVIDLVRLAGAAYVADRLSPRGAGFSRTLRVHVHLRDVATWSPLLPHMERLLSWVSGDAWQLTESADSTPRTAAEEPSELAPSESDGVTLISGGLDSFSAATLRPAGGLFISHTDHPTTSAAQNRSWQWLIDNGVDGQRVRIALREAGGKRENTTRTRAILFYALAVALADSRGVDRVEVPENGFTGLNLPFGNDRGGVLSTRSTHPWTMHLAQTLLDKAEIDMRLVNPHEWQTKGELVASAAAATSPTFIDGVATTLSCAKLDGWTYKGGNPNRNCGLCVACMTRRASIRAADIEDKTPYLATTLTGASLDQLRSRRDVDIRAVMTRVDIEVDEFVLLENGPYPDDYDLGEAADLCRRGLAELAALLPEIV